MAYSKKKLREGKRYPELKLDKEVYFAAKIEQENDVDFCRRIGSSVGQLAEWKNDNLTDEERKKYSNQRKRVTPPREKKRIEKQVADCKTWVMSEEERLAYIEKHPIKPKPKQSTYDPNFKRIRQ